MQASRAILYYAEQIHYDWILDFLLPKILVDKTMQLKYITYIYFHQKLIFTHLYTTSIEPKMD